MIAPRERIDHSEGDIELNLSDDDGGRTPRQVSHPTLRSVPASYTIDRDDRPSPLSWRVASPETQPSELAAYRFGDASRTPIASSALTTGRRSPAVALACRQTGEGIPVEDMDAEFHSSVSQGGHTRRMESW